MKPGAFILAALVCGCAQILGLDDYKIVDDTDTATDTAPDTESATETSTTWPTDTDDTETATTAPPDTETGTGVPPDTEIDTGPPVDTETDTGPPCVEIPPGESVEVAANGCAVVSQIPDHLQGEQINLALSNCLACPLDFDWYNCNSGSGSFPGSIYSQAVATDSAQTACPLRIDLFGDSSAVLISFW